MEGGLVQFLLKVYFFFNLEQACIHKVQGYFLYVHLYWVSDFTKF